MARGRPCICPICTQTVDKDKAYEYKGKYYHNKCFTKFSKQTTVEKTAELKEKQKLNAIKQTIEKESQIIETNLTDDEIIFKDKVIKYIKELLDCNILNVKIYALLKNYISTYKFSYQGIYIALKYFYQIQENPVVSDIVGILPYIYEEAQQYEIMKKEFQNQIDNININEIVLQKKVVIPKKHFNVVDQLIDINKLE